MRGLQLIISGNWGHFKRPETNNNPLTHDLITKTAIIGLVGAVLGIERSEMRNAFPLLSEDLLYGVSLLNPVKKVSWGFTSRTAIDPTKSGSPKYFEFLQNPKFRISLALRNPRSQKEFDDFSRALKFGESIYTPVLGWHNCPANLEFVSEGEFSEQKKGEFETTSFVKAGEHKIKIHAGDFRIGFDKLPTFQDTKFWNRPEHYVNIIYPDFPNSLTLEGPFYEYHSNFNLKEQCWLM
jgi:CRISPR-associated protein Cas5 subtype I-B